MEKNRHSRWGPGSASSMDGMVSSGRQLGVPSNQSYQPNRGQPTPTLGDFNHQRKDGFHPAKQTARYADEAEETEAQLLDEPIVLDEIPSKKQKKEKFWKRHAKLKKNIMRFAVFCMILILAGGAYFGYKLYHTEKRVLAGGGKSVTVCSDNVDISQLQTEGDSRINVLLLGIGGPEHEGGNLTDTVMIASIDPINDKIALISIPRDLWVRIPDDGTQKINAAYNYGVEGSSMYNRRLNIWM